MQMVGCAFSLLIISYYFSDFLWNFVLDCVLFGLLILDFYVFCGIFDLFFFVDFCNVSLIKSGIFFIIQKIEFRNSGQIGTFQLVTSNQLIIIW